MKQLNASNKALIQTKRDSVVSSTMHNFKPIIDLNHEREKLK